MHGFVNKVTIFHDRSMTKDEISSVAKFCRPLLILGDIDDQIVRSFLEIAIKRIKRIIYK